MYSVVHSFLLCTQMPSQKPLHKNPFTKLHQTTDISHNYKDSHIFWSNDHCHLPNFLHCQHCCLESSDYIDVSPVYRSADWPQTTYCDPTNHRLWFGNQGFETQLPCCSPTAQQKHSSQNGIAAKPSRTPTRRGRTLLLSTPPYV